MRPVWWAGLAVMVMLACMPGPARASALGDPLEGLNRAVFDLNRYFAEKTRPFKERVRNKVSPTLLQGLRNFLSNIAEPGVALSYMAQGDRQQTRLALERFAVNSAEGPLGFRDVASAEGLTQRPASLTDVLCHYRVPRGPYVVLPFYGGMTLRTLAAQVATISAGYMIFGEIYLGYRISILSLGTLEQPGTFRQVQFLDNGRPDPYAATRAWQLMKASMDCAP
jgi:phospholipid-binding lipoprotein MlaA